MQGAVDLRPSHAADLAISENMRSHFAGLHLPCPSGPCDGMLDEVDQVAMTPFKAFLVCSKCESRLRIHKKEV